MLSYQVKRLTTDLDLILEVVKGECNYCTILSLYAFLIYTQSLHCSNWMSKERRLGPFQRRGVFLSSGRFHMTHHNRYLHHLGGYPMPSSLPAGLLLKMCMHHLHSKQLQTLRCGLRTTNTTFPPFVHYGQHE